MATNKTMPRPRYHLGLCSALLLLTAIHNVKSFSSVRRVGRQPLPFLLRVNKNKAAMSRSALWMAAGFETTTAAYLNGLSSSPLLEAPPLHRSATEAYLSSLSQLAEQTATTASQETSPEEYLSSVSQLMIACDCESSSTESSIMTTERMDNNMLPDYYVSSSSAPETTTTADMMERVEAWVEDRLPSSDYAVSQSTAAPDMMMMDSSSSPVSSSVADNVAAAADAAASNSPPSLPPLEAAQGTFNLEESLSSSSDSLASQLSGMSYESLQVDAVAASGGGSSSPLASSSSAVGSALSERLSLTQDVLRKLLGRASETAQTLVESETAKVTQVGSSTVQSVTEKSISELADSVLHGLQTLGRTLFAILDKFLDFVAGTSVAELVAKAQLSARGVFDGVARSIQSTLHGIGEMSVEEATERLVAFLTLVSKVLFGILNAVVTVLSGRTVAEWALTARATVEQEASQLTAQASAATTDLSQKKLYELGTLVSGFSQDVGRLMVEGANSALGVDVTGATSQLVDTVMASSQVEGMSTVVSSMPF